MKYRKYKNSDFDTYISLSLKLFPHYSKETLAPDLIKIIDSDTQEVFFAIDKNVIIAFAHVSIRHDYVEGSETSPVGYLEGIYVEEPYRKKGVAKELFEIGQKWMEEFGCEEVGSNTWLWNTESQKFHEKLGFEEDDRLVHYIKDID